MEGKKEAKEIFDKLFNNKNSKRDYGEVFLFDYIVDEFLSRAIGKTKDKRETLIYERQLSQLINDNQVTLMFTDKELFENSLKNFRSNKQDTTLTDEILMHYFNTRIRTLPKTFPKYIISFDKHFRRNDFINFLNLGICT